MSKLTYRRVISKYHNKEKIHARKITRKYKRINSKKKAKKTNKSRNRKMRGGDHIKQPESVEELRMLLDRYSMDTSQWTKTEYNLLEEIINGESFLEEEDGKLIRVVKIANLVIRRMDGKTLRESYQMKDGKRKDKKNGNLTEKIGSSESALVGIERGVIEELGDEKGSSVINIQQLGDEISEINPSDSYRGMKCVYKVNRFSAEWIGTPEDFSSIDGHDGKEIFWIWM